MTIAYKTNMLLEIARQLTEEKLSEPKREELETIWQEATGQRAESLYQQYE